MQFITFLLVGLIVLDIAALRWGFDSRDGVNSPEWGRNQLPLQPCCHYSNFLSQPS
jgi:hypothetical protein